MKIAQKCLICCKMRFSTAVTLWMDGIAKPMKCVDQIASSKETSLVDMKANLWEKTSILLSLYSTKRTWTVAQMIMVWIYKEVENTLIEDLQIAFRWICHRVVHSGSKRSHFLKFNFEQKLLQKGFEFWTKRHLTKLLV